MMSEDQRRQKNEQKKKKRVRVLIGHAQPLRKEIMCVVKPRQRASRFKGLRLR